MKCPACSAEMRSVKSPDLVIEECPDCQGVFLDKDELNTLATGMSGNIEYCSVDEDFHKDKFSTRVCSK